MEEEEKPSKLEERLRVLRFEHETKWLRSEKSPAMEFSARSIPAREAEQREKAWRWPLIFADFRVTEVRSSMGKRWVAMEAKFDERESEVRSKEVTRELSLLQNTPVKRHGSLYSSQFERISGLGREDLKLSKLWASLALPLEAAETGEERESEQRKSSSNRLKRFIFELFAIWGFSN